MKLKRLMSAACCFSAVALMAVACGGESESECDDDQTFASVNGGPEQCYDTCSGGTCAAGFECRSGLCVTASNNTSNTPNNSNNTDENNSNNSNNANNSNNMNSMSNNMMSNNNDNNTNNMTCPSALSLGPCEPLCDPTGCMAGEACVIGATAPNAPLMSQCVPAGPGGAGATCDQMNGCQAGFVCAQDADGNATCQELCDPNGAVSGCSDATAQCGPLQQDQRLGVCVVPMDACDPLNDMCPAGEKCALTNLGLQCFPTAGGMAGETCDTSNTTMAPCDKGLVCAQVDQTIACQVLCDPTDGSRCMNGTMCMSNPQDPDLGICL